MVLFNFKNIMHTYFASKVQYNIIRVINLNCIIFSQTVFLSIIFLAWLSAMVTYYIKLRICYILKLLFNDDTAAGISFSKLPGLCFYSMSRISLIWIWLGLICCISGGVWCGVCSSIHWIMCSVFWELCPMHKDN